MTYTDEERDHKSDGGTTPAEQTGGESAGGGGNGGSSRAEGGDAPGPDGAPDETVERLAEELAGEMAEQLTAEDTAKAIDSLADGLVESIVGEAADYTRNEGGQAIGVESAATATTKVEGETDDGAPSAEGPAPTISEGAPSPPAGGEKKSETTRRGPPDKVVIPEELPVLPIRDAVVFPGTIVPLTIGREKSKRLLSDVITGSKMLGVVAQRKAETEDPKLDDLYRVGTVVAVLKLLNLAEGKASIIVHGLMRFGIEDFAQTEPYLLARAHPREDTFEETTELEALMETAKQQAERVISLTPGVPEEALSVLSSLDNASALSDFLAANLSLELVKKQELLETFDVVERLRKITRALANQLEILELSRKIHNEVKSQIDKSQREYYLHEQLDAIRKELGETDSRDAEIAEMRQAIAAAKMPEPVAKEADRELERMKRIHPASPEYSGILDYLHWLCEVPWAVATDDNLDLAHAEKVLEADHYGLEKVKKRILEFLAVRTLNPHGRSPILCFAGPPGVGKTSLGQSIARAMGRRFIRMSVGGIRDEADIRGHRRTYIGALPGRILQEIRKAGANNPVFMIDEVDKIGSDFRGDPSSALLEVLDPEQNSTFQDHYLGVPFDLSRAMFICTANYMEAVPPPLRDRMEVIDLPGYTLLDKLHIARKYLVPRRRQDAGLTEPQIKFTDQALERIVESYTAEAGVRNLEREIGTVCRGVAAQVARNRKHPRVINKSDLAAYLGPIKYEPEVALRTSLPGVVTGLAWTPTGGDILFVEATSMPGRGNLQLTGHLGDVMRESVLAALSVIKSHARKYHLDSKALAKTDLHIHVPAGAIPKDGPSAGVAMFTAIISLLTRRPCRSDVAMTGEITLRGLVLPIGGLKEKSLAAHRAGIKTVIIPQRNKKDLVEIPVEVRRQIKFVPVRTVDDVLKAALDVKSARRSRRAAKKTSRPASRTAKSKTPTKKKTPVKKTSRHVRPGSAARTTRLRLRHRGRGSTRRAAKAAKTSALPRRRVAALAAGPAKNNRAVRRATDRPAGKRIAR
jgi:ATP-dependent Lon protease